MKHFRDITEQLASTRRKVVISKYDSVCDILSRMDPPTDFGDAYDSDKQRKFALMLYDWGIGTSRNYGNKYHERLSKDIISTLRKCKKIRGWARYSGRVYRGLNKPVDQIVSKIGQSEVKRIATLLGANGEGIISLPTITWESTRGQPLTLRAVSTTMVYETSLIAQSWSKRPEVAHRFSNSVIGTIEDGTMSVIMEHQIKAEESLNLAYFDLSHRGEAEVIRLVNTPIKVKAWIPVGGDDAFPVNWHFLRSIGVKV